MRMLRAQPRAAGVLALNRAGVLALRDAGHRDAATRATAAHRRLEALLHAEGITDAQGEIWPQRYPRVLGYSFKPVSFWYCHRSDGSLRAIVAEVNNTFGERHADPLDQPRYGQELQARKAFHSSPFCAVEDAAFEFRRSGPEGLGRAGTHRLPRRRRPRRRSPGMAWRPGLPHPASRRRALWRYPLLTLA